MFRKLFGLPTRAPAASVPTVDQIVRDFGAYIENAGLGLEFRDELNLPYPKKTILNALLVAQTMPDHTRELQEAMLSMTLSLAQFQPNIGEPLHPIGVDITKLDMNAVDLPAQILAGEGQKARYDKLKPIVVAETRQIGELIKKAKAVARG